MRTLQADVVFLGVPYGLGHNSLPGARLGPAAIRATSAIGAPPSTDGFYDRETGESFMKGVRLVDAGDAVIPTANVSQRLADVSSAIASIIARAAIPVTLGGYRSITFAVLRGFQTSERKIHVIHLDSYQDFAPTVDQFTGQSIIQHGNHLRHGIELPWIGGLTVLGLRGLVQQPAKPVTPSNIERITVRGGLNLRTTVRRGQTKASVRSRTVVVIDEDFNVRSRCGVFTTKSQSSHSNRTVRTNRSAIRSPPAPAPPSEPHARLVPQTRCRSDP